MRTAIVTLLVATAMLAGCLGSVEPAGIDDETLQQKGWSQTDDRQRSVAFGLGEVNTREYRASGGTDATGAMVVTTTDIPLLDESRFIPQALERVEEERGIQFTGDGTTTISLPQLGIDEAQADVYTFQKAGADGKAIIITPDDCDSFVISIGYGITGAGGFSGIEETYEQARDIASNVVC